MARSHIEEKLSRVAQLVGEHCDPLSFTNLWDALDTSSKRMNDKWFISSILVMPLVF